LYFRRLRMTDEELAEDGEGLGCLEHDGGEPVDLSVANPRARSLEWTFSFPPQQHQFDAEDGGFDPHEEGTGWTVSAVDNATGVIQLRRSRDLRDKPLPTSLVPDGPIGARAQQEALRRVAASIVAGDGAYRHLERLLRRGPPLGGASLQRRTPEEQRALLDRLEGSYLVVQGPPGSGKTYRGARLIAHLLAQGRKVGVTAHRATK
jgi:hypothetical protein